MDLEIIFTLLLATGLKGGWSLIGKKGRDGVKGLQKHWERIRAQDIGHVCPGEEQRSCGLLMICKAEGAGEGTELSPEN